jgi:hypothetical protein
LMKQQQVDMVNYLLSKAILRLKSEVAIKHRFGNFNPNILQTQLY